MSRTGVLAHFGLPTLVSGCGGAGDDSSTGVVSISASPSGGSASPYPSYNTSPLVPDSLMQSTAVQIASQITLQNSRPE